EVEGARPVQVQVQSGELDLALVGEEQVHRRCAAGVRVTQQCPAGGCLGCSDRIGNGVERRVQAALEHHITRLGGDHVLDLDLVPVERSRETFEDVRHEANGEGVRRFFEQV